MVTLNVKNLNETEEELTEEHTKLKVDYLRWKKEKENVVGSGRDNLKNKNLIN